MKRNRNRSLQSTWPPPTPGALFSTLEVARFTGATLRELQWWCETGVLFPLVVDHMRWFTREDLNLVRSIVKLRERHVPLRIIRRSLSTLVKPTGFLVLEVQAGGYRAVHCATETELIERSRRTAAGVLVVELGEAA